MYMKIENIEQSQAAYEKVYLTVGEAYLYTSVLIEGYIHPLENLNGWKLPLLDVENARKAVSELTLPKQDVNPDDELWVEEVERDGVPIFIEHIHGNANEYAPVAMFDGVPYYRFGEGWCWEVIDLKTGDIL